MVLSLSFIHIVMLYTIIIVLLFLFPYCPDDVRLFFGFVFLLYVHSLLMTARHMDNDVFYRK